jgi:IclR family transcriptional regulator, pca regulon regulatory protein
LALDAGREDVGDRSDGGDAAIDAAAFAEHAPVRSPDYVSALEHGVRVLQPWSRIRAEVTLTEIARATGLVPATARRALHTLEQLGYVSQRGRLFLLRPRVVSIGMAYLRGINTRDVLEPFLWDVVDAVRGSASVAVLDDLDIVYLAHATTCRALRLSANGVQVPAYTTAMGCVLLAFQPRAASSRTSIWRSRTLSFKMPESIWERCGAGSGR